MSGFVGPRARWRSRAAGLVATAAGVAIAAVISRGNAAPAVVWGTALLWMAAGVLIAGGLAVLLSARLAARASERWPHLVLLLAAIASAILVLEGALTVLMPHIAPRQIRVTNREFAFDVSLNSEGFRDAEFSRAKPPGERRVLMIGDSQVYGTGVPQEHTLPRLLEAHLQRVSEATHRVFNLGLPGASPADYVDIAERFTGYAPDVVLVTLYVDNDLADAEGVGAWVKRRQLYKIVDRALNQVLEGCPYPWVRRYAADPVYEEAACRGEINPFLLTRAAVPDNEAYYTALASGVQRDSRVAESIQRIRALFPSAWFGVVVLPSKYQVDTGYVPELRRLGFTLRQDRTLDDDIQRAITGWAGTAGVRLFDLLPLMRAAEQQPGVSLFHALDDHLNVAGNARVAQALCGWLHDAGAVAAIGARAERCE